MFKRLTAPFREFGVRAGLLYAIDRVLQKISPRLHLQYYELMVQPIADKALLNARTSRWLEIREIKQGAPELERMPVRPEILPARFAQGSICLGAFKKGEMIGYMWFCFDTYDEDEVRCTYELESTRNSVFDFDIYIFPDHRLGLAFVGLWNGANELLRSRGVSYTFSRLTRFNLVSRRAHQHLGWVRAGRAIFLQLWVVEMMFTTLAPYFNLSLSKRTRARLKLRPDALERTKTARSKQA